PETIPDGATYYIIVRGDTLWDLAGKYLGNPYLWPQIWDQNRYITDAHWIYPGDPLIMPKVALVSERAGEAGGIAPGAEEAAGAGVAGPVIATPGAGDPRPGELVHRRHRALVPGRAQRRLSQALREGVGTPDRQAPAARSAHAAERQDRRLHRRHRRRLHDRRPEPARDDQPGHRERHRSRQPAHRLQDHVPLRSHLAQRRRPAA